MFGGGVWGSGSFGVLGPSLLRLPRRRGSVQQLMQSYQRLPGNALLRGFRVSYKRHVLTMDDLQTLYGPNWLNDQVGGRGVGE